MSRLLTASLLLLLSAAGCSRAKVQRVVFEGTESEHKWSLRELSPDLPSDWSSYEYLSLELRASSPQRFYLRVHTADGVARIRLQPFQGAWIRVVIPRRYFERPDQEGFDMAAIGNKSRNSFWMAVRGPFGPVKKVEALGVLMEYPVGKPTLEIRSIKVTNEDPGSEVLEPKPVVDELGQWILEDWPGKIKSLDQLKTEWAEEEKSLAPGDFGYCKYGGYLSTKAKATGFFRIEQMDGRWWFVDPDGHLFLSTGASGMGVRSGGTRVQGRESYYAALPPADLVMPPPPGRQGSGSGMRQVSFFA